MQDFQTNRILKQELDAAADWADFVAEKVISKFPDKQVYTCAAGISPSGVVHFGNFRDITTALAVMNSLKEKGKKVRLLFSWDDYDRFRKVPKNVPIEFKEYIGLPLTSVPDPENANGCYADKFKLEFEEVLDELGIEVEYRRQTDCYTSGMYKDEIIKAMKMRTEIGRILFSFMSEKARTEKFSSEQEFLEDYYPITIYSKFNNKDNTKILSFDGERKVKYLCLDTNSKDELDLETDTNFKLSWKIDWPMRWKHEQVVFEPGGKDHSTPGGSYDTSAVISKEIFGYEPPVFVGYDFIGITGIEGKMSSSAGNAMSPRQLLEIYTPELLLFIYKKVAPQNPFNLCFDTAIYRQYAELDEFNNDTQAIPFKHVVAYGQIVNWNFEKLVTVLEQNELFYSAASIKERIPKARNWLETYNRNELISLNSEPRTDYFNSLSDKEKQDIGKLADYISSINEAEIPDINLAIYAIPSDPNEELEIKKVEQKRFFKNVYQLLFSLDRGPRLATYIWAVAKKSLLDLIKFN